MNEQLRRTSTRVSQVIEAPAAEVYRAFMDPDVLVTWLPPGEMTGKIHEFDGRVGGGYRMSLFYPATELPARGKTAANEDMVTVRFVELAPSRRIVEVVRFHAADSALHGGMTITILLEELAGGTEVTFLCENLPRGVRAEDNELGSRQSLQQLARRFA